MRDFPELPLNEAIRRVTEKTANQFQADVRALGCLEPTQQPRATEFIGEMIQMISVLITKQNAYVAGGEVLFSVSSMKGYGALSNRKLEDQQAGARVAVDAHKRNPGDFVLWKLSSAEEPGWESPWGRGRPGWHIECSAMSKRYLGEVFDIHGGGLDLIFPHHENEIAQSRCAHGTSVMANVWMHNGFLQVEGQKMSKSLGNFVTIDQLLSTNEFGSNRWHGRVLRLAMLMTHYRLPIDWTIKRLVDARMELSDWIEAAKGYDADLSNIPSELIEALSDDLNFSDAFSFMRSIYRDAKARLNADASRRLATCMKFIGVWGNESALDISGYGYTTTTGPSDSDVMLLVDARLAARTAKDWKESDRIRDELAAMGVVIKDNKDGTTSWEIKR